MPAVFVHGVPETERIWDALRANLTRDDVVALTLPGFGRPLPEGFGATKDEYAAWLVGQLEDIGQPVDLVGHDWGGGLAMRLVSVRPDLVRTWVIDTGALADPDYVWHQFAQVWQTPGDGEAFMDTWLASGPADRAAMFTAEGAPPETADTLAAAFDRTMADAILALYRSATKVHHDWGPDFTAIPKPGLVIVPSADPFLNAAQARRSAERAGARVEPLDGIAHWWMLSEPARCARLLEEFWASAA
ncbi:MAG: alpha/beta fold hydrolase [Acidimicrobiales bacterium]